jgi:hypothetical protein
LTGHAGSFKYFFAQNRFLAALSGCNKECKKRVAFQWVKNSPRVIRTAIGGVTCAM